MSQSNAPKARPLVVSCPTCQQDTVYSPENRWRPFCSERCRMIDLGAWSDESYVVAGQPIEADDDLSMLSDPPVPAEKRLINRSRGERQAPSVSGYRPIVVTLADISGCWPRMLDWETPVSMSDDLGPLVQL